VVSGATDVAAMDGVTGFRGQRIEVSASVIPAGCPFPLSAFNATGERQAGVHEFTSANAARHPRQRGY